jgi:hypothetical protein
MAHDPTSFRADNESGDGAAQYRTDELAQKARHLGSRDGSFNRPSGSCVMWQLSLSA